MQKRKKITDFTVTNAISALCKDFLSLCRNIPAQYKYTLVQEISASVFSVLRMVGKSMDLPPINNEYREIKRKLLSDAHSELAYIELLFCILNDVNGISNNVKAGIDMKLYDIYGNLERLISSLSVAINKGNKYEKSVSDGDSEESVTEPGMIEMRHCDMEGGSNA